MTSVPAQATRREWLGLAVLALPTLLLAIDLSVTYLAIPQLTAELDAGPAQLLWIADIYGFLLAGFLITMGTLGDRIGRRKLLLTGAALFSVASVLAAFSQSPEMLIIARALLGVAGASLSPSTLALITNMFKDPKQRAVAFAVWVSCFMGGTALGPLVGGVLLHFFWWGSVFLVGVPVMIVLLITGPIFLPEFRDPDAGKMDLVSVLLSLFAILPVIYGIKDLAANGVTVVPFVTIVAGLAVGVLFVRRQATIENPLLDLRMFANRSFSLPALSLMLNSVAMSGVALLVVQHFELVEDVGPLTAGLLMAPPSLAVIASSMLAPKLARRYRPAYVIAGGMAVTAVGCLMLVWADSSGSILLVESGYLLGVLGIGPMVALATDLIVGQAEPEKAGAAGAIKETADNLGFALGAALLGSVTTAVYRHTLEIPADASSAGNQASKTLAEAVASADKLPPDAARSLLSAARSAYDSGLNVSAAIGAVIAVTVLVLVVATLRHIPPAARKEELAAEEREKAGRA
ncbi:MFS transporter [Amycolatopsis sp. CA-126428]|uniref:MFS transporter n=1 Tax=Amycolatopsis sp. CA-126428 TaxID=2073158 RepID=UPI000CD12521|nr:MFS transporter [Amycolatopsis sp. CA-126428]